MYPEEMRGEDAAYANGYQSGKESRQPEIDALNRALITEQADNINLFNATERLNSKNFTLNQENIALKAEVERLRKPALPPWSPDYGSGPVTPDRIYQYFSDGAWYDCKKMDLGFYIADNVPIRELFTRPSQLDVAMKEAK